MALTIIKTDSRGAYRMIAEHDLYLDESGTKVIVVKEGEEVPKEAATVLTGKGGTIPARYMDMLKALDAPAEAKAETKAEVKAPLEAKAPSQPKPSPEPAAAKTKKTEEPAPAQ